MCSIKLFFGLLYVIPLHSYITYNSISVVWHWVNFPQNLIGLLTQMYPLFNCLWSLSISMVTSNDLFLYIFFCQASRQLLSRLPYDAFLFCLRTDMEKSNPIFWGDWMSPICLKLRGSTCGILVMSSLRPDIPTNTSKNWKYFDQTVTLRLYPRSSDKLVLAQPNRVVWKQTATQQE